MTGDGESRVQMAYSGLPGKLKQRVYVTVTSASGNVDRETIYTDGY